MPAIIILLSSFQYDMSCHGRRPESIDINIVLNGGSQMSMNLHSVPNKEWLHFHLDFSVDNAPCGIHVTVRNQFGSVDTNVTLGKLKQYNAMHVI